MLEWYKDDELAIFFDSMPKPKERFIVPGISDKTRESIEKYPYMNLRDLTVTVFDHTNTKKYEFKIPKKYCFDGASIPGKILLPILIGAKTDNRFLVGAMVHDWMCIHKECIGYNRYLSSRVFKALLLVGGTHPFKAQLMYLGVEIFQRTQGWEKQKQKDEQNANQQ